MATLFYNAIRGGEYMSKEVPWTDRVLRTFIEKALLDEDEIFLLTTRVKNWTITKQAQELGYSERTVGRKIENIKKKYDVVQAEYPDLLPIRDKKSVKDKYLDTH